MDDGLADLLRQKLISCNGLIFLLCVHTRHTQRQSDFDTPSRRLTHEQGSIGGT